MGLFGGAEFLLQLLSVTELNSMFLFETNQKNIISKTCNDNRVNKKIKSFDCVPNKPLLTKDGIYLLNFVHPLKSLRNNWITELVFPEKGEMKTAK